MFVSKNVRTTQYNTAKQEDFEGALEQPYDVNDQPLPGVGPVPRVFLLETAYQGSGRLSNGYLLEFASQKTPTQPESVPYRFSVTDPSDCGGYPYAGNGTCAIPNQTGAVAIDEALRLVPVGTTIFIVELNLKLYINDTGGQVSPNQIDIYTGYVDILDYYREGLTAWRLAPTS